MAKILVTDPIHEDGLKALREFAEVEVATGLKPADLLEKVKGYDVLVVRLRAGRRRFRDSQA